MARCTIKMAKLPIKDHGKMTIFVGAERFTMTDPNLLRPNSTIGTFPK